MASRRRYDLSDPLFVARGVTGVSGTRVVRNLGPQLSHTERRRQRPAQGSAAFSYRAKNAMCPTKKTAQLGLCLLVIVVRYG
jgi:hypothetical protein